MGVTQQQVLEALAKVASPRGVALTNANVLSPVTVTVLAAATRISFRVPLTPAWAAIDSGGLAKFPVIDGIKRLVILVDHDDAGMAAATAGRARWEAAGRTVDTPRPKQPGFDFNDVVFGQKASSHD